MRAGRLDRKIVIEVETSTTNALNEQVMTWSELTTRRAEVLSGPGREALQAAEVAAQIDCRFRIRWSADVAGLAPNKHRVRFDGRTFNIVGVKEVGRREGLEISAQARAER